MWRKYETWGSLYIKRGNEVHADGYSSLTLMMCS